MKDPEKYFCFNFGVAAGAVGGLLMAPRSGVRTRKAIVDTAKEGQEFVKRRSAEVRENLAETLSQGKKAVSRAAESIEDVLESGRQALRG
jgi:gas vesicle protein